MPGQKIISLINQLIGAAVGAAAQNRAMFLAGRAIAGPGGSLILFSSNLLCNEILHPRIRAVGAGLVLVSHSSTGRGIQIHGSVVLLRWSSCVRLDLVRSRRWRVEQRLGLEVSGQRLRHDDSSDHQTSYALPSYWTSRHVWRHAHRSRIST